MPIDESYRQTSLDKVRELCGVLRAKVEEYLEDVDPEDLEFGVSFEVSEDGLEGLWRSAVEENNYMEVVYTEIMEHHDGAYLKATFRNALEDCWAVRYVSVRSSGRVEVSYAFFVRLEGVRVRIERKGEGLFGAFAKVE